MDETPRNPSPPSRAANGGLAWVASRLAALGALCALQVVGATMGETDKTDLAARCRAIEGTVISWKRPATCATPGGVVRLAPRRVG